MNFKHLLLTLCVALLCSQSAQAKGLFIFNTGDELFEVASFPSALVNEHPALSGVKAGYKCARFGIFWSDLWTWDCRLVAISSESSYSELPENILSQISTKSEYSMRRAKRGFWNHYGFWTLFGSFAGLYLLSRMSGRSQKNSSKAH